MSCRTSRSDVGATAVEYALMLALIFVVIVASVTAFGTAVLGLFNQADGMF